MGVPEYGGESVVVPRETISCVRLKWSESTRKGAFFGTLTILYIVWCNGGGW